MTKFSIIKDWLDANPDKYEIRFYFLENVDGKGRDHKSYSVVKLDGVRKFELTAGQFHKLRKLGYETRVLTWADTEELNK